MIRKRDCPLFSVAPMVDYTDRHTRFFHRLLSQNACLYTEMITTNALLCAKASLLFHPDDTGPVVLQLGGYDPHDLSLCAQFGEKEGYSAINLNCGCPSPRVVDHHFGVALMRDPGKLIDCFRSMQDAVSLEVTVKQRVGLDYTYDYSLFCDFIGQLSAHGVRTFIIHARNAILERPLLPKKNRSIPTLRYDFVHRIKKDFPDLNIVINGHLKSLEACRKQLLFVDGVMVGRAVLADPWMLHAVDGLYNNENQLLLPTRRSVAARFMSYARRQEEIFGTPAHRLMKYMINLMNGTKGARYWRRMISEVRDHRVLKILDSFLEQQWPHQEDVSHPVALSHCKSNSQALL